VDVSRRRHLAVPALALALTALLAACGGGGNAPVRHSPRTIAVPKDARTIQAAVDDARPGDMVLVSPGTYRESVIIETDGITLRGLDRNTVLLDGGDTRENGVMVFSNGVAVENMTIGHFKSNGVLFTGDYGKGTTLTGYRAAYLTTWDNGLYGVYAFNARGGVIDNVYASGHPDSGIYVGQCNPCDAVVRNTTGELNAVGFQATNASGNLLVVSSVWRNNRIGVEPNSSAKERLTPQHDATFVGNVISDNNAVGAPKGTDAFGVGVGIGGGNANLVERNRIDGNAAGGVVIADAETFLAEGNSVRGNELAGNGTDLVVATRSGAAASNCFADNRFSTSSPPGIESLFPCGAAGTGGAGGPSPTANPDGPDYRIVPRPAAQPNMAGAATRPSGPAPATPPAVDLAALTVPPAP